MSVGQFRAGEEHAEGKIALAAVLEVSVGQFRTGEENEGDGFLVTPWSRVSRSVPRRGGTRPQAEEPGSRLGVSVGQFRAGKEHAGRLNLGQAREIACQSVSSAPGRNTGQSLRHPGHHRLCQSVSSAPGRNTPVSRRPDLPAEVSVGQFRTGEEHGKARGRTPGNSCVSRSVPRRGGTPVPSSSF